MAKVTVRLIKPLNGAAIGSEAEYDERDAARLAALGAVEMIAAPPAKAKAKKEPAAPKNKMDPAPLNKAAGAATSPPASGEQGQSAQQEG